MKLETGTSWWDLIERRASASPDRTMFTDDRGRTLTFAEFREAALTTAAGLVDLGVKSGQIVSWQLPTGFEAAVLMAALSRLGVVQNPMIPILRRAEVGLIVEQLSSDWLVVPGVWRGFDHAAMAVEVALGSPCQVLVTDDYSGPISLPTGDPSMLPPYVAPAGEQRWVLYSSGTTATPKGARHTDASVMAASNMTVDHVGMQPDDVFPMAFPIAHVGGMMMLTALLRVGARVMLVGAFDPVTSPAQMAEQGATLLGSAVPFFHAYLAAQRAHGDEPLFPDLRLFLAGGAPVPPELHAELDECFGIPVLNSWGLTECPAVTSLAPADPLDKLVATVGRAAAGVEVRVVDGELCLKGPQQFLGYVDPTLDAAAYDDQGFFRTGDLGEVDEGGYVSITGRLKDIIIRNAENISALEIENVLYQHPDVADVAVIGLPDRRTGERACAVIVVADGAATPTLADLAAHCTAAGLARQKVPEQLEVVPVLPRNPMGKVVKHELRAALTP